MVDLADTRHNGPGGSGGTGRVLVDGAKFLICKFQGAEYFQLAVANGPDFQRVKFPYAQLAGFTFDVKTPAAPATTKETAWLESGCGFDRMDKKPFVKIDGPGNLWVPLDTHLPMDFVPMSRRVARGSAETMRTAGLISGTEDEKAALWQEFIYKLTAALYHHVPGRLDDPTTPMIAATEVSWGENVLRHSCKFIFKYGSGVDAAHKEMFELEAGKVFGLVIDIADKSVMTAQVVINMPVDPADFFGIDWEAAKTLDTKLTSIDSPGEFCGRTTVCNTCGVLESDDVHLRVCHRCRSARYCSKECQLSAWPMHKVTCARPIM